jgi:hypothetical protein
VNLRAVPGKIAAVGFWVPLRLIIITIVLGYLATLGTRQGVGRFVASQSPGERAAAASQVVTGLAAAFVLWGVWRGSRWLQLALIVWGAALVSVSILAPVVWADYTWVTSARSGIAALMFAMLVGWASKAHVTWKRRRKYRSVPYYF